MKQLSLTKKLRLIDSAKQQLDTKKPLNAKIVHRLRKRSDVELTYHSNAIENNKLTLTETQAVLNGATIPGRTLQEHIEARNHFQAIKLLDQSLALHQPLTEALLLKIHERILRDLDPTNSGNAGRYRQVNVRIGNASVLPPKFQDVPKEMQKFFQWYGRVKNLMTLNRIAELHARFEHVHPFIDGNGRTGRLLIQHELLRLGYPPAVIAFGDRRAYYQALETFSVTGKCRLLTELLVSAVSQSLETYCAAFKVPQPELQHCRQPSIKSLMTAHRFAEYFHAQEDLFRVPREPKK